MEPLDYSPIRRWPTALVVLLFPIGACGVPPAQPPPRPPQAVHVAAEPAPVAARQTCQEQEQPGRTEECRRLCDAGDPESCTRLGAAMLAQDGDVNAIAKLWREACAKGSARGCNGLGVLEHRGAWGVVNEVAARRHYEKACGMDYGRGCYNIGMLERAADNPVAAVERYRQACALEDDDGCAELGAGLLDGRGVEQDHAEAMRLLKGACGGGVARACHNQGLQHVKQGDAAAARASLQRACKLGMEESCQFPVEEHLSKPQ